MTTDTQTDLTLDEQITIAHRDHGTLVVPGATVAPGIAITVAHRNATGDPIPRRYRITHIPSGLNIPTGTHCATHARQAADSLIATGADWAQDKEALLADKDRFVSVAFANRGLCDNDRYGCPGDPDPWQIRCNTCDWEYDPEDEWGDIPIDAKAAKRIADDHECEPWVEIRSPGDGSWRRPSRFNDDGTVRP